MNSKAMVHQGASLFAQGRIEEAMACFRNALQLCPDLADAHNNLGVALHYRGQPAEAIPCFRQAIALKPDSDEYARNLGTAQYACGQFAEAIASFQQSLACNPRNARAYDNMGMAYRAQGDDPTAEDCFRYALACEPNYVDAQINLGNTLIALRRHEEAETELRLALAQRPDHPKLHFTLAFALLQRGEFTEGWREYEWRHEALLETRRPAPQPLWDGAPFPGETLLIRAEQGLGDTIQFARYLPMVKARGGRVLFECQKELALLFAGSPWLDAVLVRKPDFSPPNAPFDKRISLLSLPRLFGTEVQTIPADVPYLQVGEAKRAAWQRRLSDHSALNIGIVWGGNPGMIGDRERSCGLQAFAPLASVSGVRFFSLQKGEPAAQIADIPPGLNLTDLPEELYDFTDTAAAMLALDLVITTCTSTAHLAGAIGVPVWTVLAFCADWRWLLEREDSPWYPTMRLFRQPKPGDWQGVFTRVAQELGALVQARKVS